MNHLLQELLPYVSQYGLFAVFVGMLVEGTTMILLGGVLCYLGMLHFAEVIPTAIAGAVLGDQLWYCVGRCYASSFLQKFSVLNEKIKKLAPAVTEKGKWLAFGGRFVYGGAILFPLTLGTYNFPYKKFALFNAIGITLWSMFGTALGYLLGSGAEQFMGKLEHIWHFGLYVFIGIVFLWLVKYYLKKRVSHRNRR
jgi:membrane protein DedA with SNARE-associated domain